MQTLSRIKPILLALFLAISLSLSACQTSGAAVVQPMEAAETPVAMLDTADTEENQAEQSPEEKKLVICMTSEPDTLYIYGSRMLAVDSILEAVYDGPIDSKSYGYQPVILEKLPSLADEDAGFTLATVREGDWIYDVNGNLTELKPGVWVHPFGCQSQDCAVEYAGDEIHLNQMVVTFRLLPGLRWSDGAPLTAGDSVYAFEVASDPASQHEEFVKATASYEALDDLTVVWKGLPGFLDNSYYLNFWSPLPEHLYGQYSPEELLKAEISTQ